MHAIKVWQNQTLNITYWVAEFDLTVIELMELALWKYTVHFKHWIYCMWPIMLIQLPFNVSFFNSAFIRNAFDWLYP